MEFITIGKVANTHGIKGELKIFPTTDDITRFERVDRIYIEQNNMRNIYTIKSLKYFKHLIILNLNEVTTMDEAILLKGASILLPMDEALPLEENENYIFQLIGLEAREEDGTVLGKIKEVLTNGAYDVYVVDDGSKNGLMIPARTQFVLEVNIDEGYMVVKLIEGLKGL